MLGFIYSNQSWVIVIGVIVFLLILYLIFKALPAKVNKKESLKKMIKNHLKEQNQNHKSKKLLKLKKLMKIKKKRKLVKENLKKTIKNLK